MNYNSIALIYDNNVYLKNGNSCLAFPFDKKILNKGIILDIDKFIKKYYYYLKLNKLSTFLWNKRLILIYDSLISSNDLKVIENTFLTLSYHRIKIISDISLININKKDSYLICNERLKYFFIDNYNEKKVITLDPIILNQNEIKKIITSRVNTNLFIVGNKEEISFENINYYIYDNIPEFFFNFFNIE